MSTRLCYETIKWNGNEITFVGAYLRNKQGKRFQVDGTKRIVTRNENLYLCRVFTSIGNHKIDTFKFFTLREDDLKNFQENDIQLVGQNRNGKFLFTKEFAEGMRQDVVSNIPKISLKDGKIDSKTNSKGSTGLRSDRV